jgi:LacI family transcriptional regulator
MPAPVSIKEVANLAGVSIGTVSNVLNERGGVAQSTRQRVISAIEQLGYVRNDSARQLRAGRSRQIAIVVLDVANPFFTDVVRGAEDALDDRDLIVVVCDSAQRVDREQRYLDQLEQQRVQGILITPVDETNGHRLEALARRGTPVVLVDRGAGLSNLCSVAVNDVLGGRLVGEHLTQIGHRHIAFVGGPATIRQVADRRQGLSLAADATATITDVATPDLTVASGLVAARQIADMPARTRPTAIACANDLLALGVLQELTQRGINVPGDIAIVGYDDIEFAAAAAVPLSSVRQPRAQLGRTAIELLREEINSQGRHDHRQVVFQPELILRASCPALDGRATARSTADDPVTQVRPSRRIDRPVR